MSSITIEKILAPTPATIRGQPTQISADAKGQRIAYASGKSVFVRCIDDPAVCKQYTGHTAATTVARFSPSGFYVASGDVSGMVRVWDAVEAVNTKGEYGIVSGRINDIAWDGDSQRVIAVGDGRERFGHCITADSGNSVGEISGHSQIINAVAMRQQRPFRAATVSDDGSLVFLHGAPFKFNRKADGLHRGFVYGTAFSPDGSRLVSVGADRRIQLYDGKTGEPAEEAVSTGDATDAHTGSIFAVSWAPDGRRIATASADQTVRVWDTEARKLLHTWRLGDGTPASVAQQQVGVVWPHGRSDDLVISISLNGDLNYLRPGSAAPARVVQGHNKSITALGVARDDRGAGLWSGSFDGRVCHWDVAAGTATAVDGQTHTNQVTQFASASAGSAGHHQAYSVGWDDTLRTLDEDARTFTGSGGIKLPGQPKGVAVADGGRSVVVALATGEVAVYAPATGQLLAKTALGKDDTPTAVAASGVLVAVGGGGGGGGSVLVYRLGAGGQLALAQTLVKSTAAISALAFSGDGRFLAVGNSAGKIVAYDTATWQVATDRWSAHTSRVTTIAWNEAATHAASGSLDTNLFVWSLAKPGSRTKVLNAHKDGVSGVAWVDGGAKVASAGGDAAVKIWKVEGLP